MKASQIAELAATLTAGGTSVELIRSQYGESILTDVLAITSGEVLASLIPDAMKATGVSSLIDDVAGGVGDFLDDIF